MNFTLSEIPLCCIFNRHGNLVARKYNSHAFVKYINYVMHLMSASGPKQTNATLIALPLSRHPQRKRAEIYASHSSLHLL